MSRTLRFPAEWEPQSAVLIAWPTAHTDWAERLEAVENAYIALVAAITRFQPVIIVAADEDVEAYAEARLRSNRVDMTQVRFATAPYNDTWLRDSGPITLTAAAAGSAERTNSPTFTLLDFRFTGWGGKFDASDDDRLIERLHAQGVFGDAARVPIDFALEGGAIETDGAGTLLTTWQCLSQRHPGKSQEELSALLRGWLKQERILWLQHGYLQGDDTDAHIDTLARFAPNDAIVFQACDDPGDPHYPELQAMAQELGALRTSGGAPYRLFPLPWPQPIIDRGRRLAASYANFLIVNGAVLMPAYGDPADASAVEVMQSAFPDRQIVQVDCRPIIWQNGSLHCLTMQLPRGVADGVR